MKCNSEWFGLMKIQSEKRVKKVEINRNVGKEQIRAVKSP
jgi:hypothetical protein